MGLPFLLTTVTVAHFSFSSFAMLLETEYVLTLRYFLTTCFAGRRMGALFALFIQPFFFTFSWLVRHASTGAAPPSSSSTMGYFSPEITGKFPGSGDEYPTLHVGVTGATLAAFWIKEPCLQLV
jgi:hypothetical protein